MAGPQLLGRDALLDEITTWVARDRRRFALLRGPAGVGKTALAGAVLEQLDRAGVPTYRVRASESSRMVPFGALAPLLAGGVEPDGGWGHPASVLTALLESVRERFGDELVLFVDDLPLLDDGSLTAVLQLGDHAGVQVLATARDEPGWFRDLHLIQYFSLFLQSSAETSVLEGEESGIESALDMDLALFTPVYRDHDSYGAHAFGPVVTAGYRKSHDVGTGARRYYAGLRSSHNPESFVDLLYGKTEGVRGKRVEVRGMIPISDFAGGSFNVGGAVNLAVSGHGEQAPDSVRVQVIWRARLNEFFGAE